MPPFLRCLPLFLIEKQYDTPVTKSRTFHLTILPSLVFITKNRHRLSTIDATNAILFIEPSVASHFPSLPLSLFSGGCKLRAIVASPGTDAEAGSHSR